MNEETRKKISLAIKRRWEKREEYGLVGHPCSKEQKQKLKLKIKQKWDNHEYTHLIGKELSNKTKQNISVSIKNKWLSSDYREKNTNSQVRFWNQDKKQLYSNKAKERWCDNTYKEITLCGIRLNASSPAYREIMRIHGIRRSKEISDLFKTLWQNEEWRKQHSISHNIAMKDVEVKRKISENNKRLWSNGVFKISDNFKTKKYHDALIAIMKTSKYRHTMSEAVKKSITPEFRNKMSELSKNRWKNEKYRSKMASIRLLQPKTSSQQLILYSLLNDLKIKYYKDDSEQCKIGFYCFDCRINFQPGIRLTKSLLIEVQGDYWHSLPKNINRDKSKATYLRTYFPEFDLKYLWEHEFNNKDRVTNLLRYWLGLDNPELKSVNFNQIEQRIIDYKEAELFISKYHYAGRIGRSGINIGYYLGDQLIATIIYSSPVRQEVASKQGYPYKEVLELSRLAIHPQYQVKNLASNLIAQSIGLLKNNKPEIKLLVSFADSTYNHLGTIYKASNWILDGEVAPDYWYADDSGYICHKKTLWNKAKQMGMTESEYCEKYDYMKVLGNKKFRYIYRISKIL